MRVHLHVYSRQSPLLHDQRCLVWFVTVGKVWYNRRWAACDTGARELTAAACAFGNSLTLPLVFLAALLPAAAFDRAAGYTALFLLGWSPLLWSVGLRLLRGAGELADETGAQLVESGYKVGWGSLVKAMWPLHCVAQVRKHGGIWALPRMGLRSHPAACPASSVLRGAGDETGAFVARCTFVTSLTDIM